MNVLHSIYVFWCFVMNCASSKLRSAWCAPPSLAPGVGRSCSRHRSTLTQARGRPRDGGPTGFSPSFCRLSHTKSAAAGESVRANGSSPCCHLRGMWTPGPDAPSETGLKWHHAIVPGVVSRLAGGGAALRPSPSDSFGPRYPYPAVVCSLQRRRHAARFDSSVIRLCGMRHARTHTHRARIRRCSSGPVGTNLTSHLIVPLVTQSRRSSLFLSLRSPGSPA